MINDLNRWTEGWVDWNLLLDEQGGPNHVGNYCSRADPGRYAPAATWRASPCRVRTPTSGISRASSARAPSACCAPPTHDDLERTAFLNPDGRIAVVVMNRSDQDLTVLPDHPGQDAADCEAPAHSISTLPVHGIGINPRGKKKGFRING